MERTDPTSKLSLDVITTLTHYSWSTNVMTTITRASYAVLKPTKELMSLIQPHKQSFLGYFNGAKLSENSKIATFGISHLQDFAQIVKEIKSLIEVSYESPYIFKDLF